jgi:hypothetical protein
MAPPFFIQLLVEWGYQSVCRMLCGRKGANVKNLLTVHRTYVRFGQCYHGNGFAFARNKFHFKAFPIRVAMHHCTNIPNFERICFQIPREYNSIKFSNHFVSLLLLLNRVCRDKSGIFLPGFYDPYRPQPDDTPLGCFH